MADKKQQQPTSKNPSTTQKPSTSTKQNPAQKPGSTTNKPSWK